MKKIVRLMPFSIFLLMSLFVGARPALSAVGCDLNNPDRDVARLFPGSTGYKTSYASLGQRGIDPRFIRVEKDLGGSQYVTLFTPLDVSYTIYDIYNGTKKIGYIHGVNQKGQFGGIQVFVAQDLSGIVKTFYLQKVSGPTANKLRDAAFCKLFVGVSLKDFDTYDPITGKGTGRLAQIHNPDPQIETDFFGVMRGLKKNLVLMDEFVFSKERGTKS